MVADSHYIRRMTVGSNGTLDLEPFAFRAVVLPPLFLLQRDVAEKIVAFAKAGGKVYAMGSLPTASAERGMGDPVISQRMDELRACPGFVDATGGLAGLIGAAAVGLESGVCLESEPFPLISSRRRVNGRSFVWLANNEPLRRDVVLRIRGASGETSVWDCETGTVTPVPSEDVNGGCRVALSLEPYEGIWLVSDPWRPAVPPTSRPTTSDVLTVAGEWLVKVDPADQPALAQHRLAAPDWLLAGATRPLESWLNWDLRQFSGFVDYSVSFDLTASDGTETLDLGAVKHMAEVWVNGAKAGERLWPPFRFRVGHLLRPGTNHLRVRVGNLVLNAVTQYKDYNWKWYKAPGDDQLDAGLLGPVTLQRHRDARA
jgi:hypothetical protein